MPRKKQCSAMTLIGRRCKNHIQTGNGSVCSRHSKRMKALAVSKRQATLEKVERGVKVAGGVTGLVAGLLKIIEFSVAHWDWMLTVLENITGYAGDEEEDKVTLEREKHPLTDRLGERCKSLLQSDSISTRDLQLVCFDFRLWFDNVPEEIQTDLIKHFGADYIEVLRQHGLDAMRNPAKD